jgi:hypothetical protein
MIVCVTTSQTLLHNTLSKAGSSISTQYKQRSHLPHPIVLDGGQTSARKILFVPWELEVNKDSVTEAQQVIN